MKKNNKKNNVLKENYKLIICLFIAVIGVSFISGYSATYLAKGTEVKYDNSKSSLTATNVQDAIEELNTSANNYISVVERLNNIGREVYPVGSIYISVTNENPQTIFGGTWVSFGEGRTLVGVGSGTDSNSTQKVFAANETGGEYTHKLTIAEMPSHNHGLGYNVRVSPGSGTPHVAGWDRAGTAYDIVDSAGGSQSHNNIQPYITVYMWKRTA